MAGMKRTAETQLTREDAENENDDEVMSGEGFKRADDAVLAKRPMRGLPKRGNVVAATFDAPSSSDSFNFGPSSLQFAAPEIPFTFTAPSFGSTSTPSTSAPPTTNSPFSFTPPKVSSSASNTTKHMASILGSPPTLNGVHSPTSSWKSHVDNAEVKYYAAIRGLNHSIRAEINRQLNYDELCDLTPFFDQYCEHRAVIDEEFRESLRESARMNGTAVTSSELDGAAESSSTALSMPKLPKGFAGFDTSFATAGPSATSSGGGFKPDLSATSATPSKFSFPSTSTAPFPFPSSGAAFAPPKLSPSGEGPSSSFKFGSSSSSSTGKPFLFGSGSVFGDASSNGASSSTSNPFGSSSSSTSAFGRASLGAPFVLAKDKQSGTSVAAGFSFGSNATTSDQQEENSEPAEVTRNGDTEPSKTDTGTSMASKDDAEAGQSGSKDVSSKPSISDSVTPAAESGASTPAVTEGEEAPGEEPTVSKVLGENPHDLEGEGEEDEETFYVVRAKIYRLGKKGNDPSWNELGVGMLRIKKHKEKNIYRLLCRNSGHGKIMMNFKLYPGFKMTRSKQIVTFMGHDNGTSASFRVRVKDEPSAITFVEQVQKAIAALEE